MDEALRKELIAEMEEYRDTRKFPSTLYGQAAKQGFIEGVNGCIDIIENYEVNENGGE